MEPDPPVDDNDITEALVEDDQFLLDDVPLTEDQDADIEAELPGDVPVAEVTEDVVDDTAEVAPEQYEDAIEVFESTDAPTSAADGKLEHPVVTQSESAEAQKGLPESTLLEADMVPPSQMDEVGAGPGEFHFVT